MLSNSSELILCLTVIIFLSSRAESGVIGRQYRNSVRYRHPVPWQSLPADVVISTAIGTTTAIGDLTTGSLLGAAANDPQLLLRVEGVKQVAVDAFQFLRVQGVFFV